MLLRLPYKGPEVEAESRESGAVQYSIPVLQKLGGGVLNGVS